MYTKKSGRMTYKTNRRPNFKRNNNYSPKGRNKGNVIQQYNKYLKLFLRFLSGVQHPIFFG